jgi:hypothetical protein
MKHHLSLQVALFCQKNEWLTTLTLLAIFHHLIIIISNWSQELFSPCSQEFLYVWLQ